MHTRRIKAFRVSAELIPELLSGSIRASRSNVPRDAQVVRYNHDWITNAAIIVMEHPSFDEVPIGNALEVETVTFEKAP